MGNIWDLPETKHPVHGRKTKKTQHREPEAQMMDSTNQLMNTTSNFMFGAMGIAVMSNMGSSVISALAKK